jgi:hypothetical protein
MAVRCTFLVVGYEVGDNTDLLPRVAAAKRNLHIALGMIALGLLGFAALLIIKPPMNKGAVAPETTLSIDNEAKRLGIVIDATIKAAHSQADTMSRGTQIRAGVMTDAATVKDLVTSEIQLPRNLNQTLELVQLMDAKRLLLLRMPDGSPPIGATVSAEMRFEIDGRGDLAVVVGAPVAPVDNNSTITGTLVLSTPIDFTLTRENLAPYASRIAVVGDKWTFPLAQNEADAGITTRVPVPLATSPASVSLEVSPRVSPAKASWVFPAKLVAGVGAFIVAMVLALSLYRNRDP